MRQSSKMKCNVEGKRYDEAGADRDAVNQPVVETV